MDEELFILELVFEELLIVMELVMFILVENGMSCGKISFVDSFGFIYNVYFKCFYVIYW